jgi:Family of unknown function (DUF6011)
LSDLVGPGVYRMAGQIFVVKENREHSRCYAKKLVETSQRLTEQGEIVEFDFECAPGAIYDLQESDRLPLEEAKKLIIRYSRCIVCGRHLKLAQSVEAGIGPVCIKYFGSVLK